MAGQVTAGLTAYLITGCMIINTCGLTACGIRSKTYARLIRVYGTIPLDRQTDRQTDRAIAIIGVAKGCSGCTCTPRAVKKFSGVIYMENV